MIFRLFFFVFYSPQGLPAALQPGRLAKNLSPVIKIFWFVKKSFGYWCSVIRWAFRCSENYNWFFGFFSDFFSLFIRNFLGNNLCCFFSSINIFFLLLFLRWCCRLSSFLVSARGSSKRTIWYHSRRLVGFIFTQCNSSVSWLIQKSKDERKMVWVQLVAVACDC